LIKKKIIKKTYLGAKLFSHSGNYAVYNQNTGVTETIPENGQDARENTGF